MAELRRLHLEENKGREVMLLVGGEEEDDEGEGEERMLKRQQLFLFVADQEVLTKGVNEGWVKGLDAKYRKEELEVPEGNKRGFWQDYYLGVVEDEGGGFPGAVGHAGH